MEERVGRKFINSSVTKINLWFTVLITGSSSACITDPFVRSVQFSGTELTAAKGNKHVNVTFST